MHEVISGARDELMKELTESLDKFMRRDVGVEVLDVRVKRIDLPPEVSSAVYDRMNSERQILARQFRATGRERALEIRGDADRQVVVVAADAYRKAEETRGEGDAKSAAIYAAAFNQDPEFYRFYRSINAYVNVFEDKTDLLVLDPDERVLQISETEREVTASATRAACDVEANWPWRCAWCSSSRAFCRSCHRADGVRSRKWQGGSTTRPSVCSVCRAWWSERRCCISFVSLDR